MKKGLIVSYCYYKLTSVLYPSIGTIGFSIIPGMLTTDNGEFVALFFFPNQSQQESGDKGGKNRYCCSTATLNEPDNKIIYCY